MKSRMAENCWRQSSSVTVPSVFSLKFLSLNRLTMMMSFIIWTISSLTACGVAGQGTLQCLVLYINYSVLMLSYLGF